jgi:hypothetical protein
MLDIDKDKKQFAEKRVGRMVSFPLPFFLDLRRKRQNQGSTAVVILTDCWLIIPDYGAAWQFAIRREPASVCRSDDGNTSQPLRKNEKFCDHDENGQAHSTFQTINSF